MCESIDSPYFRKRYPAGVQSFEMLRRDDQIYIDKSRLIYELVHSGSYYFLSRPRRFGKSLLLSTIKAYFQGRKELFDGLAISDLEKEWKCFPVISLSLATFNGLSCESLAAVIRGELESNAVNLGVTIAQDDIAVQFKQLIERAYRRHNAPVVILIDEYDKPLNETRHLDDDRHEELRSMLRGFYSCVKDSAEYLRFVMLTGVTKYTHVSIFSGLNNLTDISLDSWCNAICGISESEMQQYFSGDMAKFAELQGSTLECVAEKFRSYYDGYRFAKRGENIYNPYSVMRAFTSMEFGEYWFETGTPAHLIKTLTAEDFDFNALEGIRASASEMMGTPTIDGNPVGLLYQSGYLTIKDYEDEVYTLGFPNREVSAGFFNVLLSVLYPNPSGSGFSAGNVRKVAAAGEPHRLIYQL